MEMDTPKRTQEPRDSDVQCPACRGQGAIRGPQSDMPWCDCRYCNGSGGVTEAQFHEWHDKQAS